MHERINNSVYCQDSCYLYGKLHGKPFIARNCIRRRNFVKSVIRIERNIERKKYGGSYSDIVAWKVY